MLTKGVRGFMLVSAVGGVGLLNMVSVADSGGIVVPQVAYREVPVERLASALTDQTGVSVIARGKTIGQRVTLVSTTSTLQRALESIVGQKQNWLSYCPEDKPGTFEIWDQDSFKTDVLPKCVRQKVFVLQSINAEDAYRAVNRLLTPNVGSAAFDPRSNKLFVTDCPSVLAEAQKVISEIDVAYETRVFKIEKADINAIAQDLVGMKSPAAPAPVTDERTKQIIVKDRAKVIREMEDLIRILDVDVPADSHKELEAANKPGTNVKRD